MLIGKIGPFAYEAAGFVDRSRARDGAYIATYLVLPLHFVDLACLDWESVPVCLHLRYFSVRRSTPPPPPDPRVLYPGSHAYSASDYEPLSLVLAIMRGRPRD